MTPVPPRVAELHAMPLWIGTDTAELGGWVLRSVPHAPGLRLRRTNSCLAIGDPGVPIDEALGSVRAFYAARERNALVQVEAGSEVERTLLGRGWQAVPVGLSPFHVAPLDLALAAAGETGAVTASVEGTRIRATVSVDGETAGDARAELNGEWIGVHGLEVHASFRRRGLARALMAEVFRSGISHGAATAWLEVATTNAPAQRLYAGLGFQEHHTCRYLAEPASA